MPADFVPVLLKGLMPTTNGYAIFLGNDRKTFDIYIDPFVGNALQMTLSGEKRERPLTHDLIGRILLGLGVTLEHVVINDARDSIFFARVFMSMENELGRKTVEIDARPSDSIVLALQHRRPIFVARSVFEAVEDKSEFLTRLLKREEESGGEEDK